MNCNICGNEMSRGYTITEFFEGDLKEYACSVCFNHYITACQSCSRQRIRWITSLGSEHCIYDNIDNTRECEICGGAGTVDEFRISNKRSVIATSEPSSLVCSSCYDLMDTNHALTGSTTVSYPVENLSHITTSSHGSRLVMSSAPYHTDENDLPDFEELSASHRQQAGVKKIHKNGATFVKYDNQEAKCYICSRRLKNIYRCLNCDKVICSVCVERHPHEDFIAKIDFKAGSLITLPHRIGVELEAERGDVRILGKHLDKDIMFSHDGSLHDKGIEINFPPLQGKKLEKKVKDASEALIKAGFIGTSSCGLHIHIDGSEIINSSQKQVQLIKTIYVIEDMIFSVLPSSRWDNRFCKRLADYYLYKNFKLSLDQKNLETIWYNTRSEDEKHDRKERKYDDTRYAGFNLHSLFFRGTIEFRYHSGTVQAKKILYWANLLSHIYDWAINHYDDNTINDLFNSRTSKDKFMKVFQYMLKLDKDTVKYFFNRASKFNPNFYVAFNKGEKARKQDELIVNLTSKELRREVYKKLDELALIMKDCENFQLPDEARTPEELNMFKRYIAEDGLGRSRVKDHGISRNTLDEYLDNIIETGSNYNRDQIYQALVEEVLSEEMSLRLYAGIVPKAMSDRVYNLTSTISTLIDNILPREKEQGGFIKSEEIQTVLGYSRERTSNMDVNGDIESQEEVRI
jgi:hypothetical protein